MNNENQVRDKSINIHRELREIVWDQTSGEVRDKIQEHVRSRPNSQVSGRIGLHVLKTLIEYNE